MKFINQNLPTSIFLKLFPFLFRSATSSVRFANYIKIRKIYNEKRFDLRGTFPYFIMVEPTSRCILECKYCAKQQLRIKKEPASLSLKDFQSVIDEIGKYLFFILYWNWGEPFLNKNIYEMFSYAHKKRIFGIASSDGLMLNKENCQKLIDSKLEYLVLSCNAADRESYKAYTGKDCFDRFIKNVSTLMNMKKLRRSTTPFVNLQFLVTRENEIQIKKIKKIAKDLRVDYLTFKKINIYKETLINDFAPRNMRYRNDFYFRKKRKENECVRAWGSLVVNSDGSVTCCCGDVEKNYIPGNIQRKSVVEIWDGDAYRNIRKKILNDINSLPMCRRCPGKNTFSTELLIN